MYINGIDPGFSGDLLPLAALSLVERADQVLVQEICDYGTYDDAEFTGVSFGFGTPPEHVPPLFLPGVLRSIWGGPVQLLADELGIQLDEMRERVERWTATEPIDCTMMHVDPGRVAAVRFAVEGIVDGRCVITMEHVNRLTQAAAPEWPFPPEGRSGVHRVVVSGRPGVEINTHVGLGGTDHNEAGVIATAMKAVERNSGGVRRASRPRVVARPANFAGAWSYAMTTVDVWPPRRTAPTRRAVKGQTRGDRTRQLIIDETIRCVREEGFAAISASHIAERAGVTWGVIQYHFGDRNAVLMAVVDHGYDLLRDAIDDVDTTDRVDARTRAGHCRRRLGRIQQSRVARSV